MRRQAQRDTAFGGSFRLAFASGRKRRAHAHAHPEGGVALRFPPHSKVPPAAADQSEMLTLSDLPVAWQFAALVKIFVSESLLLTRNSIVRACVVVG